MMKTPICDFVEAYVSRHATRLHMPGHKGVALQGLEDRDITEIEGADVLYQAKGIILESEQNASLLFGSAKTIYSTEGSSLAIRAMLYLTKLYAMANGQKPVILATRNVHKSFVYAAALLDIEVEWIDCTSLLTCQLDLVELKAKLDSLRPTALYLTSPDYVGHIAPVKEAGMLCHEAGSLLLVDNAHGAYLKYLAPSLHPMDLEADMCCDSAHKTLPVLTGGGYLHIGKSAPKMLCDHAEESMATFASTSPSYLILQSLDHVNALLDGPLASQFKDMAQQLSAIRDTLEQHGWETYGTEPLKLTLCPKPYGYTGQEVATYLAQNDMICEFADPDYVVLMLSPYTTKEALSRLVRLLCTLSRRTPILSMPPTIQTRTTACAPKDAIFAPKIVVKTKEAEGCVLAAPSVSCPPAVPVLLCGEVISRDAIESFLYYGIDTLTVLRNENA